MRKKANESVGDRERGGEEVGEGGRGLGRERKRDRMWRVRQSISEIVKGNSVQQFCQFVCAHAMLQMKQENTAKTIISLMQTYMDSPGLFYDCRIARYL